MREDRGDAGTTERLVDHGGLASLIWRWRGQKTVERSTASTESSIACGENENRRGNDRQNERKQKWKKNRGCFSLTRGRKHPLNSVSKMPNQGSIISFSFTLHLIKWAYFIKDPLKHQRYSWSKKHYEGSNLIVGDEFSASSSSNPPAENVSAHGLEAIPRLLSCSYTCGSQRQCYFLFLKDFVRF